jgi:hypothetical protein
MEDGVAGMEDGVARMEDGVPGMEDGGCRKIARRILLLIPISQLLTPFCGTSPLPFWRVFAVCRV